MDVVVFSRRRVLRVWTRRLRISNSMQVCLCHLLASGGLVINSMWLQSCERWCCIWSWIPCLISFLVKKNWKSKEKGLISLHFTYQYPSASHRKRLRFIINLPSTKNMVDMALLMLDTPTTLRRGMNECEGYFYTSYKTLVRNHHLQHHYWLLPFTLSCLHVNISKWNTLTVKNYGPSQ